MNNRDDIYTAQSTRLFPKNKGADKYQLTGIAARCDWIFLSDNCEPRTHLIRRVKTPPRHVFLSLRSPMIALARFVDQVLPLIDNDFVLISGSEDVTLPIQLDARWRRFEDSCPGAIAKIIGHPHLKHWFVENLDSAHVKMSPLPLGFLPDEASFKALPQPPPPLADRSSLVLCGHRHREGRQWDIRKHVSHLAASSWHPWCTSLNEPVTAERFTELVRSHSFVICVEGGGLDPAPKAWLSLLHGAIPIMRRTPTSRAYENFPVVFVPEWRKDVLTQSVLENWKLHFSAIQESEGARTDLLQKLSINYWWDKIEKKSPTRHDPLTQVNTLAR